MRVRHASSLALMRKELEGERQARRDEEALVESLRKEVDRLANLIPVDAGDESAPGQQSESANVARKSAMPLGQAKMLMAISRAHAEGRPLLISSLNDEQRVTLAQLHSQRLVTRPDGDAKLTPGGHEALRRFLGTKAPIPSVPAPTITTTDIPRPHPSTVDTKLLLDLQVAADSGLPGIAAGDRPEDTARFIDLVRAGLADALIDNEGKRLFRVSPQGTSIAEEIESRALAQR